MGSFLPLLLPLLLLANAALLARALNQDGLHLLDAKRALTVPAASLADWNPRDATPCNWTGVSCHDGDGAVIGISLPGVNLAGSFPAALCRLPRLRSVNLYMNYIGPDLASAAVARCKALERLDLSMNALVGRLPDALADLPELVYLNLGSNNFSGSIPESFGRFKKLESLSLVYNLLGGEVPAFLGGVATLRELNLSYNPFAPGPVPAELGDLSALRVLWLAGCSLIGSIPPSLGRLGNLTDLDLSTNALTGPIPPEITGLTSALQIELYNNSLSGPLPKGFGKLRELRSIDFSMNRLDGAIPEDLFDAPKLESVHLYANSLTGPVPESVAKAPSLVELRLFANRLNGTLPADLGKNTPLVCVDLSDNSISGEIPPGICDRGELEELLMLDNMLSGRIPEALGRCRRLRRVRLSNNRLQGDVPDAVWGLPHMSLLELNDNQLTGEISPVIAGAANLSKLVLSNNRLTGSIPSEIGSVSKLYELSADGNVLSGPLPASLGGLAELGRLVLQNNSLSGQLLRGVESWKKLSELNLADNGFTGSIPPELGDLPVLNYLDLSGNELTGEVPMQLENLKLNQFNVSNNKLSGPLPPQYATEAYRSSFLGNPELCGEIAGLCVNSKGRSKYHSGFAWMMRSIFIFAAVVLVAGVAWFYWRYRSFKISKLSADRSKWTLTSFHKLSFSEYEILDCLDEDNVVGSGASGKVYKAVLSNGEVVAVKKLWHGAIKKDTENGGEGSSADDSFEAEVKTLGKIRHKNIVKLWCCCIHKDCKLLVYEYMPNGSLGDVLHSSKAGLLDWPTRYKIALDAAEGLSYLHHDCVPSIVHRDVKSNNILLDAEFGARVADFGVAKVVEATGCAPKSMSVIAGSCGYIAPEYAYTLRVNEKSDTYSFGVVLLELVTGKPPVDPEFGEKDLVKWVCSTIDQKGVEHVLDSRLDMTFKEEITRVLNIGLLCASSLPINRPAMRRVVKMLQEVCGAGEARPRLDKGGKLSLYYDEDTSDQGSSV
ncbi:receptor-like protein kinase HSL1 [Phragmites australis]|uniref:receptor-like protein kinase HSL1 n=1 Tax=Phragmites australis TaxID=29695 RepID=UPI002D7A3ADE|nr:receptor-like protein kinase HSL1 [Phragmites australis]